ncbi:MAG: ribulose-phosphate 3-epimerase [bacterium]
MAPTLKILPSLLAADFGRLEAEAVRAEAAGADALHLDVMDGHFVPNLTMGPDIVKMARKSVRIPLNVHLMIDNPDKLVQVFLDAGASTILIHIEVDCDVRAVLTMIRQAGVRPGITVKPETPIEAIYPVLDIVDEVLCMTVPPGFGGQKFRPDVLPKIKTLRARLDAAGDSKDIMVDGGVTRETIAACAAHGANSFVAGVALFRAQDMAAEVSLMRLRAATATP